MNYVSKQISSILSNKMLYCSYIVQGSVAQGLEQATPKPKAVGSNPTRAIYYSGFIDLGEMAEWSKAIDC